MARLHRAHGSVLLLILVLAVVLRFGGLATKPLWVDELYTTFYSLGQDPAGIPLNQVQPLWAYYHLLQPDPASTTFAAAAAVTDYSNHPPLFFMLMHPWLQMTGVSRWSLRTLAAIAGVFAVWAVFRLGRYVGGRTVGWMAALLMAVSPFAVYLSQEARHYTLPLLIGTLALLTWLKLLEGIRKNQRLPLPELAAWVGFNGLGFYLHYFYALSVILQWGILVGYLFHWRSARQHWFVVSTAILLTGLIYACWLPMIWQQQVSSGEATQWLTLQSQSLGTALIMPWVRTLVAWVMMVVLLPVEQMPIWVKVPSAVLMLGIWGWGLGQVGRGLHTAQTLMTTKGKVLPLQALIYYALGMIGLMMGIVYGLQKDLTLAPRYFFMLYPVVCILMAVGWAHVRSHRGLWLWVGAGILSVGLMGANLTLFKPYFPGQVAQRLQTMPTPITVLMIAPTKVQRVLGLSYALALPTDTIQAEAIHWGFLAAFPDSGDLRSHNLQFPDIQPQTLWILEQHRSQPFPPQVQLPNLTCVAQGDRSNTVGTFQQAYSCQPER